MLRLTWDPTNFPKHQKQLEKSREWKEYIDAIANYDVMNVYQEHESHPLYYSTERNKELFFPVVTCSTMCVCGNFFAL